jgi:dihydroflavonol-4-reductase
MHDASGMIVAAMQDEVFLTGATGFIGRHVLHALLDAGYRVRALVRPNARPLPPHERCTLVQGDLRCAGELVRAIDGCRYLMHVAALYSFSPGQRSAIEATNVQGCAGLLEAARIAGVERAVVTSSAATVGPSDGLHPVSEESWAVDEGPTSAYHASKLRQERAALAAQQMQTLLLLPTAPVGPGDWKPTPTGQIIVSFMRGRIFAALDGGLNVVPVEDVARAHVLALRQGRPGERYLIGGENLSLTQFWALLAQLCQRRAPAHRIPYSLALSLGWADELRCRLVFDLTRRAVAPTIPLEGVRMARHHMYVTCEKARAELGYQATSVQAALERAVRWYRDNGYAA